MTTVVTAQYLVLTPEFAFASASRKKYCFLLKKPTNIKKGVVLIEPYKGVKEHEFHSCRTSTLP